MKKNQLFITTALFSVVLFVFSLGAVHASNYDDVFESEIDEETELSADDIEHEDLQAFVQASKELKEIRAEYTSLLHDAEGVLYEDLRSEAVEEMQEAIDDAGLDEETYRGIGYHVQEDDELLADFY